MGYQARPSNERRSRSRELCSEIVLLVIFTGSTTSTVLVAGYRLAAVTAMTSGRVGQSNITYPVEHYLIPTISLVSLTAFLKRGESRHGNFKNLGPWAGFESRLQAGCGMTNVTFYVLTKGS